MIENKKVSNLPSKEQLKLTYQRYESLLTEILFNIERKLKKSLKLAPMPTYKSRIKNFESYFPKVLRQKPIEAADSNKLVTLTDMMGIRVICAFLEDLSEVERQIVQLFDIKEIERKGADQTFKEFGYESVHILISIPEGCLPETIPENTPVPQDLVCEIQIRTILQDAWAEVEHELVYKSQFNPFDKPLRRKLASMNASLTLSDIIFQEIRDYQKKFQGELSLRRNTFYDQASAIDDSEMGIAPVNESLGVSTGNSKGTIDDLVLEALHLHNSGNLNEAIAIYTQIIQKVDNNTVLSVIYKHRGMAFFAMNKYDDALSDFKKSIECDPKSFRSAYYEGIVFSVQGKYSEAIECYNKSLELNNYQSHVYYRRALAYFNLNDFQTSLQDLDNAAKLGLDDKECKLLRSKLVAKFDMGM